MTILVKHSTQHSVKVIQLTNDTTVATTTVATTTVATTTVVSTTPVTSPLNVSSLSVSGYNMCITLICQFKNW